MVEGSSTTPAATAASATRGAVARTSVIAVARAASSSHVGGGRSRGAGPENVRADHWMTASGGAARAATQPAAAGARGARSVAAMPMVVATAAAGTATRLAGIAPSTPPPRSVSSRTGRTPACAPIVAPRSSRRRRGPGSRSATAGPSSSTPAVAPTDRTNPVWAASSGSTSSATRTAEARSCRGSASRPIAPARSRSPAMAAARSTLGSARTSTTNQASATVATRRRPTRPSPTAEVASATPVRTTATLEPDTATRCERPACWKASVSSSGWPVTSPVTSPVSRLAEPRSRRSWAAARARSRRTVVARTHAGGGARVVTVEASSATWTPWARNQVANPPSSRGASRPATVTRSP